ncbi:MAG: GIY-YIG nuclease family protein [Oscillospiraceae bacterium]|nr:GIY-YIG nuclease family protein [Oscillospiraceae bacterium]
MTYYVYMMTNKYNNVLYTGFTNNLIRRIYVHKEHMDPKSFTTRYHVEKLVYYESTTDVRSAIEREKQIKSWNRTRKNQLVESMNPQWRDLYPEITDAV